MSQRVYQVAEELGVTSKELLARASELGIEVSTHMSALSDEDAARIAGDLRGAAASGAEPAGEDGVGEDGVGEEVGHVVWFDKSSGQGEVEVPSRHGVTKLPFDLRRTRLADSRYVPIEPGLEVEVTVDERTIKSMRSRGTMGH